ncbi:MULTISPECIES: nuclear transport factor 2 family protein [Streptomyces]|uniref:Ketosteroid isomerase n=2 Tax=Streptomyces TaxID=1883 RepID=A0A124H6K7_9ACTN|nr:MULTISPECIES: nuclear transport factor 2 family protein [Streptomyces]ELS53320.1 putative isomerase [Streptomyces viridochromogenes Tue57]KUM80510.1 ketosteroid isomerase [Streptomyces curacoi]
MTAEHRDPPGERDAVARVREYYRLVDASDVPGLVSLFADEAVYRRPGYPPIRGHAGLESFYRGERVIERGRHTLDTVVADGRKVAVTGAFEGDLKDGRHVSLEFADVFVLDTDRRFVRRDTYFHTPLV